MCESILKSLLKYLQVSPVARGVVVISTAQLQSTKPEPRFCAGSNPACCVLEICDGEEL